MKRALFLAVLLPAAVHAQDAADDPCRRRLNEQVGACANEELAKPGRNPSDFGFWQTCRSRYQAEYERCKAGGGASQSGSCGWSDARENIDWVMNRDAGARRTFLQARGRGETCYEAVLAAQGHNPGAQSSIRACGSRSASYIDSQPLCAEELHRIPPPPKPGDALAFEGAPCGAKAELRPGSLGHCRGGVERSLQVTVRNHCDTYQDIQICIEIADGPWNCSPFFNVSPRQGASHTVCEPSRRVNVQSRPRGSGRRFVTPSY